MYCDKTAEARMMQFLLKCRTLCRPSLITKFEGGPLDRVRTDPGKSWNFIVQNSRPGKFWKKHRSWKTMEIPENSWNSKAVLLDF